MQLKYLLIAALVGSIDAFKLSKTDNGYAYANAGAPIDAGQLDNFRRVE